MAWILSNGILVIKWLAKAYRIYIYLQSSLSTNHEDYIRDNFHKTYIRFTVFPTVEDVEIYDTSKDIRNKDSKFFL